MDRMGNDHSRSRHKETEVPEGERDLAFKADGFQASIRSMTGQALGRDGWLCTDMGPRRGPRICLHARDSVGGCGGAGTP